VTAGLGTEAAEHASIHPPKLILLDLDGTLLGTDGEVSDRNSSALRRAVAAGARVVIATGRPPRWLEHLRASIPASIALCCNGGLVLDLDSDLVLASSPVDGRMLLAAIDGLRDSGIRFSVAVEGLPDFGLAVEPDFPFRGDEVRRAPLAELCAAYVVKVLIRPEESQGSAIVERFGADYSDVFTLTRSTNDGLIEISSAGTTKGAVIAALAHDWGIERADAIAFGDMPNDIEMLSWAGRSVAMGNADAAVKAMTSEVAAHHDDDGVGRVLERWF
jgi:Cof subfamily protein (haloacid dehalogenase superfamily)